MDAGPDAHPGPAASANENVSISATRVGNVTQGTIVVAGPAG
ncbi:MAG TPA: hypothetical protein VEC11_17180 [Allosphingosinicella sp.]|nr:hypothetical protein [Allosphingosinicella sp.]